MRALSLREPRQAAILEEADPSPGEGEVLVRIRACGICGLDLNALHEALHLVHTRGLDLASVQTHTWPLERAAEAFAAMEERPAGFLKAVVYP